MGNAESTRNYKTCSQFDRTKYNGFPAIDPTLAMQRIKAWWSLKWFYCAVVFTATGYSQTGVVITSITPPRQFLDNGESLTLSITATGVSTYQWKRNGQLIPGATASTYVVRSTDPFCRHSWYNVELRGSGQNSSATVISPAIFVTATFLPASVSTTVYAWGTVGAVLGAGGAPAAGAVPAEWRDVIAINPAVALKPNGTVVAWDSKTTAVPPGLSGVVEISEGAALKADGTVVSFSSQSPPAGLTGVSRIQSVPFGTFAVKKDGSLVSWGAIGAPGLTAPSSVRGVVSVASGGMESYALREDGTVIGLSRGDYQTVIASGVGAIAAGTRNLTVLKQDGTIVDYSVDTYLTKLPPDIVAIASSSFHRLALKNDGTVIAWGTATSGETTVPTGLAGVVALAAANGYSLALVDTSGARPPAILESPVALRVNIDEQATFRVLASSTPPYPPMTYQWRKDGLPLVGATTSSYTIAKSAPLNAGLYDVVVRNSYGATTSAPAELVVNPASGAAISEAPANVVALLGTGATFRVSASGSPTPKYQWLKDGAPIPGATGSQYSIPAVSKSSAGSYSVAVTNVASGFQYNVVSSPATLVVAPPTALRNFSLRTAPVANQTIIFGAVVAGGSKDVLVRAAGPALRKFGLAAMTDPRLEIFSSDGRPIASSDDWLPALAPVFTSLGAFAFDEGSRDAAIVTSIAGPFTVQASGRDSGTILIEAYDVAGGSYPRFTNLSARNRVGTGADILIAGFTIAGTGTKQLLIRAVGPSLGQFGVADALLDPRLQIFSNSGTVLATNDNWDPALAATSAQVGAFALVPGGKDAALLVTLNGESTYTVQVSGADGGTGEALVEIYELF